MAKTFKILLLVAILLPVVLAVTLVVLYSYTPVVDRAIIHIANKLAEDNIRIQYRQLSGNLLGTVRIDDLTVIISQDTLTCKRVELDYSLLDFARKKFDVQQLALIRPLAILHAAPEDTTAVPDTTEFQLDSLGAQISLEKFPFLKVERLIVKDGSVQYKRSGQTETIRNLQMQLSAEITEQRIAVQPKYLRAYWENRNITLQNLSFQLIGNKQRITLNQLEAKIPEANLVGHGEMEFEPEFRFLLFADTTRIEFSLIRKLWPDFLYQEGYLRAYGAFLGVPGNFVGDFFFDGKFDSLIVDHFRANYQRLGDRYYLEDLEFQSNLGRMNGSAELSSRGRNRIDLRFADLNLKSAGLTEQPFRLNGEIDFDFRKWDLERLSGKGNILLTHSDLGYAHLDTIFLKLEAERGDWQISPPSRLTFGPGSRFSLEGKISRERRADIFLRTSKNNLDTLFNRLYLQDMGGNGGLDVHLTGPVSDPSLTGELYLDSLVFQNSTIYGVEGNADVTSLVTNRQGYFDLSIATGFLGNIFLTSGEIKFKFNRSQILFAPLQFYSEENFIFARGFLNFPENLVLLALDSLQLQYEKYSIRNDKQISAEYFSDTLRVNAFSLRAADAGYIKSGGFFAFKGNSSFSLDLKNIRLEPFNQYFYWDHLLTGYVDSEIELFGELAKPEIDWRIQLNDLVIDRHPLGKMSGDFSLKEQRLTVNFFDYERSADSYVTVNGSVDVLLGGQDSAGWEIGNIPLDLNIVMGNLRLQDYTSFYEAKYPLEGSLSGRIDLAGNVSNPRGEFIFQGEKFRYADYIIPEFQAEGRIQPNKLLVDLASINFLNSIIKVNGEKTLHWDPRRPAEALADKSFRMRVKIEEDSLNFLSVLNPELDRLTGDIDIDLLLAGNYDDPRLIEGDVRVENGTLFLSKLENSIGDLSLKGHMEGSRLILDKFAARSPKKSYSRNFLQRWFGEVKSLIFPQRPTGYISASGYIDFPEELIRPRLHLDVGMNNAYFNYFLENTRMVLSANKLHISGQDTITISGEVVVDEADVELNFAESEKNLLLTTTVREIPPFLQYDFAAEILPKFVIRSNEALNTFNMNLSGDLRITQEPRGLLEMYGTLETSGKYFIQGEDFSIQSGKIDFVNPKELPELNLVAQKRKNNLMFNLNVRGRLNAPEKELIIQDEQGNTLPYPDVKDQMALLLFGVTFDQLSSNTDALLLEKGEQVVTQAVIATIEKEARTFTGLDQIRLETQESFFKNRLNQPATLALGKYLTPKLYLEYQSRLESSSLGNLPAPSLSWEAGNQIYLQYRLNRNWSFSTIFQKTYEGNDKVKLDISWQVTF